MRSLDPEESDEISNASTGVLALRLLWSCKHDKIPSETDGFRGDGRSVIIGFQKTQIYQRFAGSRQEVFILKI